MSDRNPPRRNNRFGRAGLNLRRQHITVIALVGNDGLGIGRCNEQDIGLTYVGLFGARQGEPDRLAKRINNPVALSSEIAARTAQSLLLTRLKQPLVYLEAPFNRGTYRQNQ